MTDVTKNISQFIEDQFPSLYRDNLTGELTQRNRSTIIDFVEAYYEFVEQNYDNNFLASRNLFEYRDVDTTLTKFVDYFKSKYLNELPFVYSTDDRFVIKNIIDLYRSKGSEKALKLLIRLLFNENVEVYYPQEDILRASASQWVEPKYIEVTHDRRNYDLLNTTIFGSASGASAFVESVVTKRIRGKFFDVIYLSNFQNGDFITGERISNTDVFVDSPKIIGSLSGIDIDITSSNPGYSVGQLLNVKSDDGKEGVARVKNTLDTRDNIVFNIDETGFGYNLDTTEVLISDAILFVNNANSLDVEDFDIVSQPLFKLDVENTNNLSVGDQIDAFNSSSPYTANVVIIDIESGNSVIVEKRSGTLDRILQIQLQDSNIFSNNDLIEEETTLNLDITNTSGSFSVGERVVQADIINDAFQNIAYGVVVSSNSTTLELRESWGEFVVGKTIQGQDSKADAEILQVNVLDQGSTGELITSNSTSVTIKSDGDILTGKKIRGSVSKNINEVTSITSLGVNEFILFGNPFNIVNVENITASGKVVGKTDNIIAVSGNTNPFYFTDTVTNLLNTENTSAVITRIGKGSGASFEIGSLNENTLEFIDINSDIIGENNISRTPYLDIVIGTSQFSGIGRIKDNVTVISGGSGYSNTSTVTVSGGGFNDGEPLIPAQIEVVTDNSGSIVDVNVLNRGEGYYQTPSVSISDGSGASLNIEIETGYGFPKLPYGNFNNATISEILDSTNTTIGEIKTIKNVNPGSGYDTNVFSKVINRKISEFNKYDFTLSYVLEDGVFAVGEVIETFSGARGRIESINTNSLKVKRLSLLKDFKKDDIITGQSSLTTATISSISLSINENQTGSNATVSSNVILQSGVIDQVEIVNSGFGYSNLSEVSLLKDQSLATQGIAKVEKSGTGAGFWRTTNSHLNKQRIQDSFFYQEYSYQIIGTISLKEYEDVVRNILHVSGTELFGKISKELFINNQYDIDVNIEKDSNWVLVGGVWNNNYIWLDNKSWID